MAKYRDVNKCKNEAEIIQFKGGESWRDRHSRRLNKNKEHIDKYRNWCERNGVEFRLLNNGEHWQSKKNNTTYDWWPRSAKLIVNQKWKKGTHVHDYTQLIKFIGEIK